MSSCISCGAEILATQRFCTACGAPAGASSLDPDPPAVEAVAPVPAPYVPDSAVPPRSAQRPSGGTPGIGIAGFVIALLGGSVLGLILSWVGYRQAVREGRPKGLCTAGIVISIIWLAISIGALIFLVVLSNSVTPEYLGT